VILFFSFRLVIILHIKFTYLPVQITLIIFFLASIKFFAFRPALSIMRRWTALDTITCSLCFKLFGV